MDKPKVPTEPENYLYAVLNLPKDVSQAEINERHRALSLLFHPDKQTDETLKAAATKEFLDIQKAYQVLSDPFLRQVYDTLGAEGLAMQWPPDVRSKRKEEIQEILKENRVDLTKRRLRQSIIPKGKFSCSLDASTLFAPQPIGSGGRWTPRICDRIRAARVITQSLVYGAEKRISANTAISFEAQSHLNENKASIRFIGSVRHQFSPRIVTLNTLNFFYPYSTKFEMNYEDSDNALNFKTSFIPISLNTLPPVTLSLSRRSFSSKPQRGKIALHVAKHPSISFFCISPPTLDLPEDEGPLPHFSPPTTSGLKYVAFEKSIGIMFDSIFPRLIAETSLTLIELSTRFKASIQFSFAGTLYSLGAHWSNETTEVSSTLVLNATALLLQFDFNYLEQQLSLPIVLSTHSSPMLALGTVIIPSTLTLLGYHFFALPRRRAQRYAHIRAAKRNFEEDYDSRRDRHAVQSLLKDAVRKQVRLEAKREGLIIKEASYGAAETELEDSNERLLLDVTNPVQALVRNSQLHIPGCNSKVALQGFSDPAPFASKSLRIRYLFRGRMHYAEIPDYMPVVLPLAEHQVKGSVDEGIECDVHSEFSPPRRESSKRPGNSPEEISK